MNASAATIVRPSVCAIDAASKTLNRVEAVKPELAHRHVGHRAHAHVRARVHVVWLDRKPEAVSCVPVPSAARAWFSITSSCAVCRKSHRNRSETSTLPTIRPVDDRQVAHRVVTPAPAELLAEARRPVLRAHLPTVDVQHGPAASPPSCAAQSPAAACRQTPRSAHPAPPGRTCRIPAPTRAAAPAGCSRRCSSGRTAGWSTVPPARPIQPPFRVQFDRQVDDASAARPRRPPAAPGNSPATGRNAFTPGCDEYGRRRYSAFSSMSAIRRLRRRRRERQHHHILVERRPSPSAVPAAARRSEDTAVAPPAAAARHRKRPGPFTSAALATRCCIDCSGFTHGPPLPVQPGPAFSVICQPQPLGFGDGVLEQLPPLRRS